MSLPITLVARRMRGGAAPSWAPAGLYASGEPGAYYNVGKKGAVWADTAGTIAAAEGDTVARVDDLSGNDNHLLQATAAYRPVLAKTPSGKLRLEFDGVDDFMAAAFTIPQPWTRTSAVAYATWVAGGRIFHGGAPTAGGGQLLMDVASPQIRIFSGQNNYTIATPVGTPFVNHERANGTAASRHRVNRGAWAEPYGGADAAGGITIGGTGNGGFPADIRFYGAAMIGRDLTADELVATEDFMADLTGEVELPA